MKAQAIILAGGFGTRLRPLTEHIPKPLAPVLGKSVYLHILDLLAKHNIKTAVAALGYKAEQIKALKHKEVNLSYFIEEVPLGTAGCVKNAEDSLSDTFIVISGDAICDFDLSDAIKKHKELGTLATILLTRVNSPLEYGGVLVENGFVKRFVEKPAWRQTLTDNVSSGIYIIEKALLELIPKGEKYDFARDLFVDLMQSGKKIGAIVCEGYWCDIGDLDAYYRCCFDAVRGKIKLEGEQSNISPDCDGDNATVIDCIIHSKVKVGGGSVIEESIICEGCNIGKGCVIGKGSVIGANTVLGDGVVLAPRTIVGANKNIKAGGIMLNGGERGSISEGRIGGRRGAIDCGFCMRLGRAFVLAIGEGCDIGVLSSEDRWSKLYVDAFCCGIRESGGNCVDLGSGFVGYATEAIKKARLDGAVHIATTEDTVFLTLFDNLGLPPERILERKIVSKFIDDGNEFNRSKIHGKISSFDSANSYLRRLLELCGSLDGMEFIIGESTPAFFKKAIKGCGAKVIDGEDGIDISLDFSGHTSLNFYGMDFWHCVAAAIAFMAQKGQQIRFALPHISPDKVREFAESIGAELIFYSPSPSDKSDAKARELASSQPWLRDSFLLCALLCSAAKKHEIMPYELGGNLFSGEVLEFSVAETDFEHDVDEIASRMREICEERAIPAGDGARLDFEEGSVVVVPSATGFRLFAQSVSMEAAKELCTRAKDIVIHRDAINSLLEKF